ncbi:right-handed parallel beta-helix repeat-containing protein [Glaciimonas soli]|uniref:Right handed beta helix domain-containing protein n=1 Tax=Glaciimonas soli TaxID=2590999 RepID=A0A843YIT5_9BURK|nr:right-handed parallel beta-helix repeat-containing protein [Glaciimonas soli]MQQ99274.1 hypothetical protein [Glaciimonas soli]
MRNQILKQFAIIALSIAGLTPDMASAASAVIPIDPNRLADTSNGFLVVISKPGSYQLTGNLNVPNANTTAIEINADNVTIDLNGFTIQGPARCSSRPVICSPTGPGNGIHAVLRENIVIRNGYIRGMGNLGIYLETHSARVDKLNLIGNGTGAATMFGGLISNSVVKSNGGVGIFGLDIKVRENIIRDNRLFGLEAYGHSVYANNKFRGNNNNAAQVNKQPTQAGSNLCHATDCH